tara:strand:- start:1041 stop:1877 length:837 start_codon:yes stop_codon:yes gene_type:complete
MPKYNWVENYIFINQEGKKINMTKNTPIVLIIGGHDPTGGAGVLADAQTLVMNGCYPISLITCLTAQNTINFESIKVTDTKFFNKIAKVLLKDIPLINAIKIGALGNEEIVQVVKEIIINCKNTPVVLDPVIETSSGGSLINNEGLSEMKYKLLSNVDLITPNIKEAKTLTGKHNQQEIIQELNKVKSNFVLIKDNEKRNKIENSLFKKNEFIKKWEISKVKGKFQGTGCSMSSSIASNLAKGLRMEESIELAQNSVYQSLQNAIDLGSGQKIPKRFK